MFRCLLVGCVLLWCAWGLEAQQCTSPPQRALKISITSRRNSTGHWVAETKLEHEAERKDVGPFNLDIEHTTVKCGDTETITTIVTVSGKYFHYIYFNAESILFNAVILRPSSAPRGPSSPGYDLVPGLGYYKLHTDVKSWHEALKTCEQEGAHLAIINSENEAQALVPFWDMNPKILDGGANNWAHIGFHDQYKEGQYVTIFNKTLVGAGYVKWFPGEPTGAGHNCGIIVRKNNLLADIPCEAKQPFFCEMEV
ncbi:hypothetical protein ANN_12896 [Periplaneta americana]|uniref:C-type lectin domain-containing protein n=1 Tax=Periplaneta americana TaxID=6978 RepID=A0ABQ8TIE5_PERAM|nr:hypothetical protein ANN_12896 [Periplaneta americana]